MEVRLICDSSIVRKLLNKEDYKRYIYNHFMSNGKICGTLRFDYLQIKKDRIVFSFKEVKVGGILHIEWSDIHDYIVKYFGTHEPGKNYYDLVEQLKKLRKVKFDEKSKNFTLCWENNKNKLFMLVVSNKEIFGCLWFDKYSIEKLLYSISDKKITKEQFLTAYNEVFGGLQ